MPVDQTPTLPYDTARCPGGADKLCDTCLRFLAPGNPYRQAYMPPPHSIRRGECASHIPQELLCSTDGITHTGDKP